MIDTSSLTHVKKDTLHLFISPKPSALSGSAAVRALLVHACGILGISDSLDEDMLPYRLAQSGQLVSFSHSTKRVAIAISKPTNLNGIGVDVEDNHVSIAVAQRFFALDEINWLQSLHPNEQPHACKTLWMTKEAYIKAQSGITKTHLQQPTLFSGLKTSVLTVARQIIKQSKSPAQHSTSYQLADTCFYFSGHSDVVVCWQSSV